MRRTPLAFALALILATGVSACSKPSKQDEGNEVKAAIAAVASKLDVPPDRTLPAGKLLGLPDTYGQTELTSLVKQYQMLFSHTWIDTLHSAGLDVGWPGDLRLVAYDNGNEPSSYKTTCPDNNQQSTVVSQDSGGIFYCATDTMSVPGMVKYPQGTLWVPLDVLLEPIHPVGPTAVTPGQQAAQALFVRLTALWADGLTRQIRAYAADTWKINLPKLENVNLALEFGFCVAGALGRAVFGQDSVVPNAVQIIYGNETATPQRVNAIALKDGFAAGTIGACVQSHWPLKSFS